MIFLESEIDNDSTDGIPSNSRFATLFHIIIKKNKIDQCSL